MYILEAFKVTGIYNKTVYQGFQVTTQRHLYVMVTYLFSSL